MKKITFKITICLFISISSLKLPNIGDFKTPKATIEVSASTHSVKKVKKTKKLKKKSKKKKNINKIKSSKK